MSFGFEGDLFLDDFVYALDSVLALLGRNETFEQCVAVFGEEVDVLGSDVTS